MPRPPSSEETIGLLDDLWELYYGSGSDRFEDAVRDFQAVFDTVEGRRVLFRICEWAGIHRGFAGNPVGAFIQRDADQHGQPVDNKVYNYDSGITPEQLMRFEGKRELAWQILHHYLARFEATGDQPESDHG